MTVRPCLTARISGPLAFRMRCARSLKSRICWPFPWQTGTAANALALASLVPPYGAVYCHREAHINVDECGAPELYTGGAKLVPLAGEGAKIAPHDLAAAAQGHGVVHHVQPAAVSITQATEAGCVYSPDEVAAVAETARSKRLRLHMDGARFANAVAALDVAPAEITWQAGVEVLSFGATKNGCLAAEAVVFFQPELAETFAFHRKRAGHLFSKGRVLSAQLEAYLADDLWLENARHANAMARRLGGGLRPFPVAACGRRSRPTRSSPSCRPQWWRRCRGPAFSSSTASSGLVCSASSVPGTPDSRMSRLSSRLPRPLAGGLRLPACESPRLDQNPFKTLNPARPRARDSGVSCSKVKAATCVCRSDVTSVRAYAHRPNRNGQ